MGQLKFPQIRSSESSLLVYQPTQFVIWGGNPPIVGTRPNVSIGQDYTFWGAQWSKQVQGGSFQANASFKGYADQVANGTWTSDSGNSSNPPSAVVSFIGVIVSTQVAKYGNTTTGDIAGVAVLEVDNPAAYKPDPGHPGTGVLVAVVD